MKVLVLLEVDVPDDSVTKTDVREHVRDQVIASRGTYTGRDRNDWRAEIDVRLRQVPRTMQDDPRVFGKYSRAK